MLPCAVSDQLDATLGDRARGRGLLLGADLVDDDDLGHVVLDRFDHHRVLQRWRRHLHAPRAADPGCGMSPSPAISFEVSTMIDALAQLVGEHARDLAQHGRLADTGAAEQQDAAAGLDEVANDLDRPVDRAADAQVRPTTLPARLRIAEMRWSVRSMPARLSPPNWPMREITKAMSSAVTSRSREDLLAAGEARLGQASEIHDDLEKPVQRLETAHPLHKLRGRA